MQIDIRVGEEYQRRGVSFWLQRRSANTIAGIPVGARLEVKGASVLPHAGGAAPLTHRSGAAVQTSTCGYGGGTNETHLRADKCASRSSWSPGATPGNELR